MNVQPQIAEYFADFGARLARLVRVRGMDIEPPTISSRVAAEVLELAGAVAHTSERKFAPLAAFVTGIAVGELRAAGRLLSESEVAAFVAQLREELDIPIARQPPDSA
jgi:hypothetical protein